jgi:hypothetical protein
MSQEQEQYAKRLFIVGARVKHTFLNEHGQECFRYGYVAGHDGETVNVLFDGDFEPSPVWYGDLKNVG